MRSRAALILLLVLCHVSVTSCQTEDPIDPETVLSIANRAVTKQTVTRGAPVVSQTQLRTIVNKATDTVKTFQNAIPANTDPPPSSFPFGPQLLSSERAREIGRSAEVLLETATQVRSQASPNEDTPGLRAATSSLAGVSTSGVVDCPFAGKVACNERARFRTITGVCNNLRNPLFGSSNTPFERSLPPVYEDGLTTPRSQSVLSGELPLPRAISTILHEASNVRSLSRRFTQITMEFGQFVSHDNERTAVSQAPDGSDLVCCPDPSPRLLRLGCFPIEIPRNDPFFSRFRRRCMEFARALPSPPLNCRLGPRQQLNQETAFLDGSAVYGSTEKLAKELRVKRGGLLRTTRSVNGDLLLQDRSLESPECRSRSRDLCFKAGDPRVNQQPALMSMHTLWLREHNRVARELSRLNKKWKDETIYQEARKIVSAEFQHVVYDEFLPVIIGNRLARAFGFPSKKTGYSRVYDRRINAQITSSFSTAGYRFGHSLVQTFFAQSQKLKFRDHFLRPDTLYERSRGPSFVIKSLFSDKQQKCDRLISSQLTNTLFEQVPGGGIDLAATNIQRGRDFGVPSYNDFRQWCGLPRAKRFDRRPGGLVNHNRRAIRLLKRAYQDVNDIDLWTGAVSERVIKGAVVGPTVACIVGRQFDLLKRGDRFFFENNDRFAKFTPNQLNQIRKTSFARIICDNTDTTSIQKRVFRLKSRKNRNVKCKQLPSVDLTKWRKKA